MDGHARRPHRRAGVGHPLTPPVSAAAPATPETAGAAPMDAALARELATLARAGLTRVLRPVEHRDGATVVLDGHRVVDFASNDYLALAGDRRIAEAARAALADDALGGAAARLIAGNHPAHEALERELAAFKRTEAALLFPSGYAANTGAIPALVGPRDAVYLDALDHASLIDGARLSRAAVRTVPHGDVDALDALLAADAGRVRRQLVVVDGVFSMDGDVFPLDRLLAVTRRHGAWTYVDDAHGTGVLGATGRGTLEACGVEGEIDVVMGTLGKGLGVAGAFVAGSRTLIDFLRHRARTFVFTTASPPALAAATRAALRIAQDEGWRRERVRETAARLRAALAALGYPAAGTPDGHIVPVVLHDTARTMAAADALRAAGFLVGAVRPPTVPLGGSRLRLSVSAAHTPDQVDALLAALGPLLSKHTA